MTIKREAINKMVRAPDHEEDECSVLVDEGEEPKELEKELR